MGANLNTFFSNLVRNKFSWKRGLCQFLIFQLFPIMSKIRKKLWVIPQKNAGLMDGQTDNSDFIGPSATEKSLNHKTNMQIFR